MTYEERLADFAKEAHEVFKAMNWKWMHPDGEMRVPSSGRIYNQAAMLASFALREQVNPDTASVVRNGRIVAFIEPGTGRTVRFAVEMGMGIQR